MVAPRGSFNQKTENPIIFKLILALKLLRNEGHKNLGNIM